MILRLLLMLCIGILAGWLLRDVVAPVHNSVARPSFEAEDIAADGAAGMVLQKNYRGLIDRLEGVGGAERMRLVSMLFDAVSAEIDSQQCDLAIDALEYYLLSNAGDASAIIAIADCNWLLGAHQDGIDQLLAGLISARSAASEYQLKTRLAQKIADYSVLMQAQDDLPGLDLFYQDLIVRRPEEAGYYLDLARIRTKMGDLDGAISVLLQIQQDALLGAKARQQITDLEGRQQRIKTDASKIPLEVVGSKLLVNALIDGEKKVRLMIDTGASVTIISGRQLRQLGYRPDLAELKRFNTANGSVNVPVMRINSLSVAANRRVDLQVGVADIDTTGRMDGLLGMNFLRHYQFVIDQNEQVLYLVPRVMPHE